MLAGISQKELLSYILILALALKGDILALYFICQLQYLMLFKQKGRALKNVYRLPKTNELKRTKNISRKTNFNLQEILCNVIKQTKTFL